MPNLYLAAGDSTILVRVILTGTHTHTQSYTGFAIRSHALDSSPNNFHLQLDFRPVFLGGNSAVWNLSRTEIFSRHEDINAPDINAVNGFANVCRPVDY